MPILYRLLAAIGHALKLGNTPLENINRFLQFGLITNTARLTGH
jgi:hypothetical protein